MADPATTEPCLCSPWSSLVQAGESGRFVVLVEEEERELEGTEQGMVGRFLKGFYYRFWGLSFILGTVLKLKRL